VLEKKASKGQNRDLGRRNCLSPCSVLKSQGMYLSEDNSLVKVGQEPFKKMI
jgi:hypothetical protein